MITASIKNYRISPRKMRIVADMIRGKGVIQAKNILANASRKARHPLSVLLDSAIANASHNHKTAKDNLFVKEIRVDKGFVLHRYMPVSRGSAHPIKKKTSHVRIVLAESEKKVKKTETTTKKKSNK